MIAGLFDKILVFVDRNLIFLILIAIVLFLVKLVSIWQIFKKLSIASWKAIVPIYNIWILLDLLDIPLWMIFLIVVPFVNFLGIPVMIILIGWTMGKACHKNTLFCLGMAVLPIIFFPILSFSNFDFTKPNTKKTELGAVNITLESMTKSTQTNDSKPTNSEMIFNKPPVVSNNILDQIPTIETDNNQSIVEPNFNSTNVAESIPEMGTISAPSMVDLLELSNDKSDDNVINVNNPMNNLGIVEPNAIPVAKIVDNRNSEINQPVQSFESNDRNDMVNNESVLHNPSPTFNNLTSSIPQNSRFIQQEDEKYTTKKDEQLITTNGITDPSLMADPTLIFQMGSYGPLLRDTNKEARNMPEPPSKYCPQCHSKNKLDCPVCIICGYNFDK